VTDAACSGATTSWILDRHGSMPAQQTVVSTGAHAPYDVIFLTIGGDDLGFSDLAEYCLINPFIDGPRCLASLDRALLMLRDGALGRDITMVLDAVRLRAASHAKIVMIGYPDVIRNVSFTIPDAGAVPDFAGARGCVAGRGAAAVITVGRCLAQLSSLGDDVERRAVEQLDASERTDALVFVSTQASFAGTMNGFRGPNHELIAPISPTERLDEPASGLRA
jgi:hypothetical protein